MRHLMRDVVASRIMSRTTLDLDPSVLRDLRRRGRQERKSMGQVASELLAATLAGRQLEAPTPPLRWVSRDLGRPRIDLEDKEALRAILDTRG